MTSSAMSASTARSRRQVGTVASSTSASPGSTSTGSVPAAMRTRRPGGGRVRLDPDPGEELALFVGGEGRAEQPVDPRRPEGDVGRRRLVGVRIDRARGDLAARPLGDEARRPVGADPGEAELLALLETQAGLGAEGVAERRPADADRVEDGRLDDDVGGPLPDLGCRRRP